MNQGTLDQLNDKFEYKLVTDTNANIDDAYLNEQGRQGWELAFVINSNQGRNYDRYYFKRFRGA